MSQSDKQAITLIICTVVIAAVLFAAIIIFSHMLYMEGSYLLSALNITSLYVVYKGLDKMLVYATNL